MKATGLTDGVLHINPHQTKHFFVGFIRELRGHLKASENSFEFDKGPSTLVSQRKINIK